MTDKNYEYSHRSHAGLKENKSQKVSRLSKAHNIPIKTTDSEITKKLKKLWKEKSKSLNKIVSCKKQAEIYIGKIEDIGSKMHNNDII